MFNSKLILTDIEVPNRDAALTKLAGVLLEHNLVTPSFPQAIIKREEIYPTGLHTDLIDVAIPHTDKEYVIEPSVAVATLKAPVSFQQMGTPEETVYPKLIMMLAIKDPKRQLGLLKNIMALLQDDQRLEALATATDKAKIVEMLSPVVTQA